jgi:hypothetical protein
MGLKPPDADIQDQSLYLQYKAYAAIVYLRGLLAGWPEPESLYVFGAYASGESLRAKTPVDIDYVTSTVTHAFKLVDREEIHRGFTPEFDMTRVKDWFPTARERMDCRGWLTRLFVAMELDLGLLDRAFP